MGQAEARSQELRPLPGLPQDSSTWNCLLPPRLCSSGAAFLFTIALLSNVAMQMPLSKMTFKIFPSLSHGRDGGALQQPRHGVNLRDTYRLGHRQLWCEPCTDPLVFIPRACGTRRDQTHTHTRIIMNKLGRNYE